MSIVVRQTLPYTRSELQLDDPNRWGRLFPVIRPSVKVVKSQHGQEVVIDTALATSQDVLITVIGNTYNFPSKILSESNVAAFTIEETGIQNRPPEEVTGVMSSYGFDTGQEAVEMFRVLSSNGFDTSRGVVVVAATSTGRLQVQSPGLLVVNIVGEVTVDHVLSLLSSSNSETRASLDKTKSLLEVFMKSQVKTTSNFQQEKIKNGPAVYDGVEVAEFNSARLAVDKDLSRLLKSMSSDTDVVYSVHFSDINGLSRLENNILAHEISEYFAKKKLPSYITHSSIFNDSAATRGWGISLCPIPVTFISAQLRPSNGHSSEASTTSTATKPRAGTSTIQISDSQARKIIIAGCESVIADEPTITEYDTKVGDGDCGYTLRDGAKQVLEFVKTHDLSNLAQALSGLVDHLEVNMGGTSGALYCIFLSALAQTLLEAQKFPDALSGSLDQLLKYTRARLGDRTCLDCLIPFVETLTNTGDAKKALEEAAKGVETTKKLEAKLGRSSYLDEATTRDVPDPGAYGLLKLLEGMVGVL